MHGRQGSRLPARAGIAVAGLALLALTGCGGGGAALGAQSVDLLHERVAAVRSAADADDRAAAIVAVEAFRAEVRRLLEAGELTDAEAAGLLAHADAIAGGVLAEVVVPTPTPTPTPEPSVEPPPTPAPTMSPEQVEVLRQETAERLSEMLRERLSEYVQQQVEQRRAQEKAQEKAQQQERKRERERDQRGGAR